MLIIRRHLTPGTSASKPEYSLTLTFDERRKSRLRAKLDDGTEVALMLERGSVLRGGDALVTDYGSVVLVKAADEMVSTVHASCVRELARVAYHLGNRHVPLEVGDGWVRYEHDHVLDNLVAGLGLSAVVGSAPFEPEGGSYGRGGHSHEH